MISDLHGPKRPGDKDNASPPVYEEIIDFFQTVSQEKERCKRQLRDQIKPPLIEDSLVSTKANNGFPLLDREALPLDYPALKEYFTVLLDIAAGRVKAESEKIRNALATGALCFEEAVQERIREEQASSRRDLLSFLLHEAIKPVFELHAEHLRDHLKRINWQWGYCPVCGGDPFLGVLRHEQGTRYLVCSLCSSEWVFPRIKCPFCESTNHQSLWYFAASGDDRCRVEVCNDCKRYIKTIDQRRQTYEDGLLFQNVKTLHLDIIAHQKGYMGKVFVI